MNHKTQKNINFLLFKFFTAISFFHWSFLIIFAELVKNQSIFVYNLWEM